MATYTVSIADAPSGTFTKVKSLLGDPDHWDYDKPEFTFEGDAADLAEVLALEGVALIDGPDDSSSKPSITLPEIDPGDLEEVEDDSEEVEDDSEEVEPEPEPEPEPAAPPAPNVQIWCSDSHHMALGASHCAEHYYQIGAAAQLEYIKHNSGAHKDQVAYVIVTDADGNEKSRYPR